MFSRGPLLTPAVARPQPLQRLQRGAVQLPLRIVAVKFRRYSHQTGIGRQRQQPAVESVHAVVDSVEKRGEPLDAFRVTEVDGLDVHALRVAGRAGRLVVVKPGSIQKNHAKRWPQKLVEVCEIYFSFSYTSERNKQNDNNGNNKRPVSRLDCPDLSCSQGQVVSKVTQLSRSRKSVIYEKDE